MKYIFTICLVSIILTSSCSNKQTYSDLSEKDSLQQRIDSIHNIDVKLSFKEFVVGDSMPKPDKNGLFSERIKLSPIDDYSYIGNTSIDYLDEEGHNRTAYSKIQVDILNSQIAKISLLSDSWGLCKFFIDTYNNRFYESEPITTNHMGAYNDRYIWYFKNQCFIIDRLYHKDKEFGMYNITDAMLIEYKHNVMSSILDSIFSVKDSLKQNVKNRLIESEIKRLRNNI